MHQNESFRMIDEQTIDFLEFDGHLGRHLENNTFCMVRFWEKFDMLLSTPNIQ